MRAAAPWILWGPGYENVLRIAYFDNANSWSDPRDGYEVITGPSGAADAWWAGEDHKLAGDARWIATGDTLDPWATGWDGPAGWHAFLSSARRMEPFRVLPDPRNLYASPLLSTDADGNGVCDGHMAYWSRGETTYSIDQGWQRIAAAFTTAGQVAGIFASAHTPAWPGMPPRYISIEARAALPAGAAAGSLALVINRFFYAADGLAILGQATVQLAASLTAGALRYTVADAVAPPQGTASMRFAPSFISVNDATANGATGWLRNMQVELNAFTGFVDSSSYVESRLLGPLSGEPPQESDGTRRVRPEFVAIGDTPFTGY